MKLLSLPILVIAGTVLALGVGSFMYATSGLTYTAPKHHDSHAQADSGQVQSTDGASSTVDGSSTALSGNSSSGWDSGIADNQNRQGGDWGNGGGGGGTPEEREQRRQQRMQQLANELGLTEDQKQKMADIRKNITDRTQRRAAIMAILTPEQQVKMEQMRAQRGNRGGNGSAQGGAPPPAAK